MAEQGRGILCPPGRFSPPWADSFIQRENRPQASPELGLVRLPERERYLQRKPGTFKPDPYPQNVLKFI